MPETTDEKEKWNWLRKADLKVEAEAMLCAAQEQAIRTNYMKHKIDKTVNQHFLECVTRKMKQYFILGANVKSWHNRGTGEGTIMLQEYFIRNCVGNTTDLKRSEKWYDHAPEGVVENKEVKILWDVMIHCDREIKPRKPDIVVVNKNERSCTIIDIAIPGDIRVSKKEKEKVERYHKLKREIKRMWYIRSIKVIPVVVGALGSTSKTLKNCIKELGVVINTALLQKTALLGTAHILRKVLDCG